MRLFPIQTSAFMDRAYFLFNNTKSIADEDRQEISELFTNLTQSTKQQKNPEEINVIIDKINKELSEGASSFTTTSSSIANLTSSYPLPTTNANATNPSNANNNSTSLAYISKIRTLLDQVVATYTANDTAKARELATTAYLDNFERIEKPIGKELSDTGEQLLRVQLRDQISSKAPLSQIKQTISEANKLIDKAESILK